MSREETIWEALGISKARVKELWDLAKKVRASYDTVSEIIRDIENRKDLVLVEKLALLYAFGYTAAREEVLNDLMRTVMGGIDQCA